MTDSDAAGNASSQTAARPRAVQTASARLTLLITLGEFTLGGRARTPTTASLVRTLAESGVGHHAARQAVRRCARSGWIAGERDGRESRWALTDAGRSLLSDGIARVEGLGGEDDRHDWDGRWLVVISSVPQQQRSVRERLYRQLRWNGFGSPMPGLWICARPDRRAHMAAAVRRCALEATTASFLGTATEIGLDENTLVSKAWDLPSIAHRYADLVARFEPLAAARKPERCLAALLELDRELQTAPSWDPQLPAELTPDWAGRTHAAELLSMRRRWIGPARERWYALQS